MHTPLIIACRNESEAARIKEAAHISGVPSYFDAINALTKLADLERALLITTSLLQDDTAIDFITKTTITSPTFIVLWAQHAPDSQNLLRIFGSGCSVALGPDELDQLKNFIDPDDAVLDDMIIPPFFIDDYESSLKDPSANRANRLHVTFLGSQALMSCSNAILNITASPALSFSCAPALSPWARSQFAKNISDYTLWHIITEPQVAPGTVTLCNDFSSLCALEPAATHLVVCHGHLTDAECAFVESLMASARVFTATPEGYVGKVDGELETTLDPEQFWDHIISSLYNA